MRFRRPTPAMGVALLALFVAMSGTAVAAAGAALVLGHSNFAGPSQTGLASYARGRTLNLTNTSTGAGATALGLNVSASRPPMIVNSSVKVSKLNADKLDGLDSRAFLRTTGKAADANKLDGLDSTAFLRVGAKAADAETVDGVDSADLVRGTGRIRGFAADPNYNGTTNLGYVANHFYLQYQCGSSGTGDGSVVVTNLSDTDHANVFVTRDGSGVYYQDLDVNSAETGAQLSITAPAAGATFEFYVQAPGWVATISMAAVNRATTNCHVQGQFTDTTY